MAITTKTGQRNVELRIMLDDVEYNCQFTVATHTPPAWSRSTTVEKAACPDTEYVTDTESFATGTLSGTTYTDTSDTGLTWLLRKAQHEQAELDYEITHFPELGPTGAIKEAGTCRVRSYAYPEFSRGTTSKHNVDLELLTTSGPTRPTA